MPWPIPCIPLQQPLPKPKYLFWCVVLILMLIIGMLSSLWLLNATSYTNALLAGALPAFLLWLCFFGVVFNRYEQSVAASLSWNIESERTKTEWQNWSRKQLTVVGNVLFSPEEKGIDALLEELDKVPAYPKKARPLFYPLKNYPQLMDELDQKLEQQCQNYREFLCSIVVLQAPGRLESKSNESIFNKWDLIPVTIHSIESVQSFYDSTEPDGLILVICLQDWQVTYTSQSSEFISAQLITSPSFARQQAMQVIAGLTRIMPLDPGGLSRELDMFFEYNQPDKQKLNYVWVSGTTEKNTAEIMQYATQHQWSLPERRPLHSIDLCFGPPGEMALPLSLSMLADAANKTGEDQLLIYQVAQQKGALCLVTRELYA